MTSLIVRARVEKDASVRRVATAATLALVLSAGMCPAREELARPDEAAMKSASWPLEAIHVAKDKIAIPIGEAPTTHVVELPAVERRQGQRVVMRFKAHLDTPRPAGWNYHLKLAVNDRPLGSLLASGESRLLNRGTSCQSTLQRQEPWWGSSPAGGDALLTFFAPEDTLDDRIIRPRVEPQWYVLDVSDAIHYVEIGADNRVESAIPNKIALSNTCLKRASKGDATPNHMAIEGLAIGYLPEELVVRLQTVGATKYRGEKEKERLAADGWTAVVTESAGIRLDVAGDRYFIASSFSYPGKKIGHNRFDPDESEGEDAWKPRIRKTSATTIRIEADAQRYRLVRTLSLADGKLRVADRFENKTDKPVGILIRNSLATPEIPKPGRVYLAGMEDQIGPAVGAAENPTVFIAQDHGGVGIVAEDNVHRLQLALARRVNAVDLAVDHFGLDAKQSYTLEWTVYPRSGGDYWDFINATRRDWNVNFTINGPFAFGGKMARGRKDGILAIDPWFEDYCEGALLTREQFKARCAPVVAELRRSNPTLVVMPKLENNLISVDKREIPGGNILPTSEKMLCGKYGLELTREQTAVLEKHPYADSVLRTADGRMIVDTFYAADPFLNLMVYPAKGNHRHKTFLDQIDFLMDQVGFNGIYIDQFSLGYGVMDRLDRCTREKWDGHTVDIDEPTGEIVCKYTDCALVGAAARADIVSHVLHKGGRIVANSFPCVRETQSLPAFRFAEMDNDNINALADSLNEKPPAYAHQAKGHLASPIILGLRPSRWGDKGNEHWAELITKGVITGLRNGVLYYYYESRIPDSGPGAGEFGPVNHMFPFTPVELHSGWLVGKERTIACVSGTYAWPHEDPPECHRFDLCGREMPHKFQVERDGEGWRIKAALEDWNEIAVIEAAKTR